MQARGGGKSKEHLEAGMSVQGAARNVEGTASGDEDKEGEPRVVSLSSSLL